MKRKLLITLALTLSIISCEKHEEPTTINPTTELPLLNGESNITFSESVDKWNSLKIANRNSYYYQRGFTSWTGNGSITQIKVINGVVTEKIYQSFIIDEQTGKKTIIDNIVENQSNLGTNSNGEKPITIDEIYTICKEQYLDVDASTNRRTLTISSDGIIKECGYFPYGCMDDCFFGVHITGFQWIK